MTEPQSQMPNGQLAADPTGSDHPAEPPAVEPLEGAVATAATVQESLRTGLTATTGVLREWADGLAGLPFSVLARVDVGPIISGRSWLDGTFELVDVWWTVHRRSVEQLMAVQRSTTTQMVDSAWAFAEMNRALVRRPGPAEPRTVPSAPR
jgi:hypothetical protein